MICPLSSRQVKYHIMTSCINWVVSKDTPIFFTIFFIFQGIRTKKVTTP